jgi:preprotein translocase SecY subunit
VRRRATSSTGDANYLVLLTKGDLPKRIFTVLALLALCRVGYYIPLYGFDVDAAQEYFARQASNSGVGFIDQLFGGGLGRTSLFSLGIGPYITASIIFQILTTVTPSLKSLAQGEEGEAGRDKYKGYMKQSAFALALVQGYGQMTTLQPFVFDNQGLWPLQIVLQFAIGSQIILFFADKITEQKLGNGTSLLVFSSIVANLPRTAGTIVSKAAESDTSSLAGGIFGVTLLVTILGVVYVLSAERRIPIVFAKRLQDEASGQGGTGDAGESYLPIKLNASGVLPLIFAGSLLSLPALAANYTKVGWLQPIAKNLLPGSDLYIPLSCALIFLFSYISTFQVLDPKDMSTVLRKQAAAIPQVRPGKETEEYIKGVLERQSVFGGVILAILFVLPNVIENLTNLSTPNSFGGTSLLILVGVAADTWRQLQAELLMQQYASDVDTFYKGKRDR